ncbi:MAG: polymer-forming cytoskeletal protein [Hyphomicrobiaceae bacterium]|nr:polymer-forming cytoskeletal protein [Hyphomicrobiaceae bacterium]
MFSRSNPPADPSRTSEPGKSAASTSGFFPAGNSSQPNASPPPIAGWSGSGPVQNSQSPDVTTSVIGKDLHIAGEKIIITCQSRLQVDGEIVGDLAGREIIIGETASVTGSVAAESVEVRGKVNGAIRGSTISLRPSAKVEGDILHQTLAIAEGAHFDGRVRRAKDSSEITPPLDPAIKA